MKKTKSWIYTALSAGAVTMPIVTVISCGGLANNGGSNPDDVTTNMMAKQIQEEKAVLTAAATTEIKVKIRPNETAKYRALAEKFNSFNKGVVKTEAVTNDGDLISSYTTISASDGMGTLSIADANVLSALISNTAHFAKPMLVTDFMSSANASLYDVFDNEMSFAKEDIDASHLSVNSNANNVQFGYPLGYGQSVLYTNYRMIDPAKPIYAWVPSDDGTPTMIDAQGNPTSDVNRAFKLADDSSYDSIQATISKAGNKNDPTSVSVGAWLGYGPGNMQQRIYSIAQSSHKSFVSADGTNSASAPRFSSFAMAFKEQLGGYYLLASSGAESDGLSLYDPATKMIKEAAFEKLVTKENGFSDNLARYFWEAFGGYMSKNPASFINHQGIADATPSTGEVEPFMNKQTMFMQNASWAARMANANWDGFSNSQSFNVPSIYHGSGNMLTSGDVVQFSLPYGEVAGDSYILDKGATPAETLVAKRFLKFLQQTSQQVSYTDQSETINESVAQATSHNFLSDYAQVREYQKQAVTPSGAEPSDHSSDAYRIYASALKGFDYGKNDLNQVSDAYNNIAGPIWKNTDTDFFSRIQKKLMVSLQYFMSNNPSRVWTYDEFKAALKDAAVAYYQESALI